MSVKDQKLNQPLKLGDVLTKLMIECDIEDAELSRQTGIPASSISRMRLNPDANPTASTLLPLAKFFDISINQLLGDESLPKDRLPGTQNRQSFTAARMPVIQLEWIEEWIDHSGKSIKEKLTHWISTEKNVGDKAFALTSPTDSLGLSFRKGSVIIVDPDRKPQDRDLIVLRIKGEKEIVLRQILKDGTDLYLRSINPEITGTKKLEKEHRFFGVIVETRFSLQEDTPSIANQAPSPLLTFGKLKPQKAGK